MIVPLLNVAWQKLQVPLVVSLTIFLSPLLAQSFQQWD